MVAMDPARALSGHTVVGIDCIISGCIMSDGTKDCCTGDSIGISGKVVARGALTPMEAAM